MHIVIDGRFLRKVTGGIGRYTRALIRELAQLDRTNRYSLILTPADEADWDELAKAFRLDRNQWRAVTVTIPHYSLAEQTQLPKVLADLKPDLVHFLNFNHPLRWRGPFVVTIHDLTILKYPIGRRQQSPIMQLGFRFTLRQAIRNARTVITVTETSKQDLVSYLGADPRKITVTYEGVDPLYQPLNLPQRGRIQRQLAERYAVRPPYLLFVSQWRSHKGIGLLLSAYEDLRKNHPKLAPQLVIAGKSNPNHPDIPARIAQSPYQSDILTPGFFPEEDLPKLYQGAEAVVFPSEYEGFSLTPLEAMACGTPVIASDATCHPEVLDGAARLIKLDDFAGWVGAMVEVLTKREIARSLRAKGIERARQFSWQTMARQTLSLYRQAIQP